MKNIGRIAVLGAGNIGLSIASALADRYDFGMTGQSVIITRRSTEFTTEEEEQFDCLFDNRKAVSEADIVILAVQPKQADEVLNEIAEVLLDTHVLISVVSGLSIKRIQELTGRGPVVRAMPNIAIQVRESMTGLAFSAEAEKHAELAETIFRGVGKTLRVPEEKFAEATIFLASDTALFLSLIQMIATSCYASFDKEKYLMIVNQVAKGAIALIESKGPFLSLGTMIDKVSTRGGCTVAMLEALRQAEIRTIIHQANQAGIEKARELYS